MTPRRKRRLTPERLQKQRTAEAKSLDGVRGGRRLILWHRTDVASDILANGFRNGTGTYLTADERNGVWLSNVPIGCGEGARGEDLLRVALDLCALELLAYEWFEVGKPYREFFMPAELVNARSRVSLVQPDDGPAEEPVLPNPDAERIALDDEVSVTVGL
jgi:hypothetical protein